VRSDVHICVWRPSPHTLNHAPHYHTGHSLGAALGVLCVLDLLRLSYPVQASINFGQPRAGNREVRRGNGGEVWGCVYVCIDTHLKLCKHVGSVYVYKDRHAYTHMHSSPTTSTVSRKKRT
jgi:hypothetical protein